MPNHTMANKGRALQDLAKAQCVLYLARGVANIQEIATNWIPHRQGGQIAGAHPAEKSTLDFRGTVQPGISVSFDCKESSDPRGLKLDHIAPHQIAYMRLAVPLGEVTFLLVEIKEPGKPRGKVYVVDGETVIRHWDAWKANKGKRGFNFIPVDRMFPVPEHGAGGHYCDFWEAAGRFVKPVPERACRAHWFHGEDCGEYLYEWRCDDCLTQFAITNSPNYCPGCGAKIETKEAS